MNVSWVQQTDTHGTRPTPLLWQSDLCGFKLMSTALVELLCAHGADLLTFTDVEVRLRNGDQVPGYTGVLEPVGVPAVVHSEFSDRRTHRVVVDDSVAQALRKARLPSLQIDPVEDPFPGDTIDD